MFILYDSATSPDASSCSLACAHSSSSRSFYNQLRSTSLNGIDESCVDLKEVLFPILLGFGFDQSMKLICTLLFVRPWSKVVQVSAYRIVSLLPPLLPLSWEQDRSHTR